jgi:hypothetical protein
MFLAIKSFADTDNFYVERKGKIKSPAILMYLY